jgi:hypothetical protein
MGKDFIKLFETFLSEDDKKEIIQNIIDNCQDDGIKCELSDVDDDDDWSGSDTDGATYLSLRFGNEDYSKKNNVLFDANISDYFCDIRNTLIESDINVIYCGVGVAIKNSTRKYRILRPARLEQAISIVGKKERVMAVTFTFKP